MNAARVVLLNAIAIVVGVCAGWKLAQKHADTAQVVSVEAFEAMPLPEIVAQQLRSGNAACPGSDRVLHEACLLYQGALGTWHRIGLPDACPPVLGPGHWEAPASFDLRLLGPEDALRAPLSPCFGYLYAIQVANVTPILVNTATRTFQLALKTGFAEPGVDADQCLQSRHGICGNHTAVGIALFEKAGFKARAAEFYYRDNGRRVSHILPEVWVDGGWRPVDTTFGAYWVNNTPGQPFSLRTLDELLAQGQTNPTTKLVFNAALLPYGVYSSTSRPSYFAYLNAHADVVRGGHGQVHLTMAGGKGSEKFMDRPNYLGDNSVDGDTDGIFYRLDSKPGVYEIRATVTASAIGGNKVASICVDTHCQPVELDKKDYAFVAVNPDKIYLRSDEDVAYVVIGALDWERKPLQRGARLPHAPSVSIDK